MEKILQRKKSALAALYTSDSTAFKLYQESIVLRTAGKWRDAGDKLVKSADLYLFLRLTTEAATLYFEAGDCYMKVDRGEALKAFQQAIKTYCEVGKFVIAGQIEKRVATLHYRVENYEDAATHFHKASNFLSGDGILDQSDYCLEKAAECYIYTGEYREAQKIYETLARNCVNSNLRRLQARTFLLWSCVCLLGQIVPTVEAEQRPSSPRNSSIGEVKKQPMIHTLSLEQLRAKYLTKYSDVSILLEDFAQIDFMWKTSRHSRFIDNILEFRRAVDLHQVVDHMYFWNSIEAWPDHCLVLWQNFIAEIEYELRLIRTNEADLAKAAMVVEHSLTSTEYSDATGNRSSIRTSVRQSIEKVDNLTAGKDAKKAQGNDQNKKK